MAKRSKPRGQSKAERRANRHKSVMVPHANAQSLSVVETAQWLGVSGSTVKRMCRDRELAWFRTRGPNGHIRVLAESVEKFRQGGEPLSVPVSSRPVVAMREGVEELRARLDKRKLERELSKLDTEDAEAERQREAVARAEEVERKRATEEAQRRAARDAEEHRARERERQEADERREWTDRWVAWALGAVPKDAPREVELDVAQAVEETLARLAPEQPQTTIHRLVLATIEKALTPWRRRKEIETAIQLARKELPVFVRTLSDYFEPTEWEVRAMETARQAIAKLPAADSSLAEVRVAAVHAGKEVAAEYEAEQVRARAERERQQRECSKKFRVDIGVDHVAVYLTKLHSAGELWDEDLSRKPELEAAVRKALEEKLTGDESLDDAQRLAREVIDAELE